MAQLTLNLTQQSDIPSPVFAISYDSLVLNDVRADKTASLGLNVILTAGTPRSERFLIANMADNLYFHIIQPDGVTLLWELAAKQEFTCRAIDLLWIESTGLWAVVAVNQA